MPIGSIQTGGIKKKKLYHREPYKRKTKKNEVITYSYNTSNSDYKKNIHEIIHSYKIDLHLKKEIKRDLRRNFYKFLKDKRQAEKYKDWLLLKYPLSSNVKTKDVYQVPVLDGENVRYKYHIAGTGNKKTFLIDGERKPTPSGYNFMIKITLH